MSEPAKGAEPPSVLQPQNLQRKVLKGILQSTCKENREKILRENRHLQSGWDDHELLFVMGRGNSLEGLQPLKGILSALSLVGGHATDLRLKDGQVVKVGSLNQQIVQCARRSWREP